MELADRTGQTEKVAERRINTVRMSKTITLVHVVFCTRKRLATINPDASVNLYRIIHELLNESDCYLYRINAMPNHVHLLFNLSPRVALADMVKNLKSKSSQWMSKSGLHPIFKGWGKGYFSASVSPQNRINVINYIKNQQEHHKDKPFDSEIMWLYKQAGLQWHDDDMT